MAEEIETVGINIHNYRRIPENILQFPKLKKIIIYYKSVTKYDFDDDLVRTYDITSIRESYFTPIGNAGDFIEEDFSILLKLPNLTILELKNIIIDFDKLLPNISNITQLIVNFSIIKFKDLPLTTNIKCLSLKDSSFSDWSISNSMSFSAFSNIKRLEIRNTPIRDYEFLQHLSNLKILSITYNDLRNISFLEKSSQIEFLSLCNNKLHNIQNISKLINLKYLDVINNEITDISPLFQLSSLNQLYFYGNSIVYIDLYSYNFLRKFYPKTINDIKMLKLFYEGKHYYSAANNIRDIEVKVTNYLKFGNSKSIKKTNELYPIWELAGNDINSLSINFLEIDNFHDYIQPLEKEILEALFKKITFPPKEIITQGHDSIIIYFKSLEMAKNQQIELVHLNEIKIILIGEGLAGKTSLLKRIKGLPFEDNESQTHGVIIDKFKLKDYESFNQFKQLNNIVGRFWDFGGQEIMHSSHQFFLSNRSIYILLVDSRSDSRKEYWLKHIQKYSNNSPTIVVINKVDENKSYDVERQLLSKKYTFIDKRFCRISCKTNEGLNEFYEELASLIPKTEISKALFNPNWVAIKESLEESTTNKNYIDQNLFETICSENGVVDKTEQNTLLNYLNSLGIALHFEKLDLTNFYVLDPHWVTIAVYKIINSRVIDDGILKEPLLNFILNEELIKKEEYDPAKSKNIKYNASEQAYIIKIMREFELLYRYDKNSYLVPDLLPKEPKKYLNFNENNPDNINFILKYDFLPVSIISRFIIRMKNDINDLNCLWRTGVKLHDRLTNANALVKADLEERKIFICVNGEMKSKRDYFSVIKHALSDINNTYDDLIIKEVIPLFGFPEIEIDFYELIGYENAGKDDYFIGRLGRSYSVSIDFLDKYIPKSERQIVTNPNFKNQLNIMEEKEKPLGETFKENSNLSTNDSHLRIFGLNIYPWIYILFGFLIFIIFLLYASSGSEINILGFKIKQGDTEKKNMFRRVTIVGTIMYGNKFPKNDEVKQVYLRGLTVSPRVILDNNAFMIRDVEVPSDKLVRIGIQLVNNKAYSTLLKLPEPNSDQVCELGEVLLDVEEVRLSNKKHNHLKKFIVVIRNQNIQNN